jgi:hypothetical protein
MAARVPTFCRRKAGINARFNICDFEAEVAQLTAIWFIWESY